MKTVTTWTVALLIALYSFPLPAEVPDTLHFQGFLTDNANRPLSGSHTLRFALYDASTAGNLVWEETASVTLTGGFVDRTLGETNPLDTNVFDGSTPLYLGLKVDNDPEMTPRRMLSSVPFATRAAVAEEAANVPTVEAIAAQVLSGGDLVSKSSLNDQNPTTSPVSWFDLTNVPNGFADGVDNQRSDAEILALIAQQGYMTANDMVNYATVQFLTQNYYNKTQVNNLIGSFYTEFEVDTLLAAKAAVSHNHAWADLRDVPATCGHGEVLSFNALANAWGCSTGSGGEALTVMNDRGLELQDGQLSLLSTCANGQVLKWDSGTMTWACAADIDTNTDTTYSAMPNRGVVVQNNQIGLVSNCADGQVLKYDQTHQTWVCSTDDGQAYTAGSGLTLLGNQFSADTSVVQKRLAQNCPVGQAIREVLANGNVACQSTSGGLSGVTAGTGLTGGGTSGTVTLAADTTYLQRRITPCPVGQMMTGVSETGAPTCQAAGDITTITAGSGLSGGAASGDATLSVDTSVIQSRVSGTCPDGNAVSAIAQNGQVTCRPTGGIASINGNNGLTGGGSSGDVFLSADSTYLQRRVTTACSDGEHLESINEDGTAVCSPALGDSRIKLKFGTAGACGGANGWTPASADSSGGVWLESCNSSYDSGGLYFDGNTAALWSPGDGPLFRVYDEDDLGDNLPVPYFGIYDDCNDSASGTTRAICTYTGAYLSAGGVWTNSSDRNSKENLEELDSEAVLQSLAALPLYTWNYIAEADEVRHIGPMAQDFHAAFGFGNDPKALATIDTDGVSLASIQALYHRTESLREENERLTQENQALEERLQRLEALVNQLVEAR